MTARRLIVYLLLNALVSAVATLSALWLWDGAQAGGRVTPIVLPTGSATSASVSLHPSPQPSQAGPTALPATATRYTVMGGDTLGSIAQQYDLTVEEIMAANGLTNPNVLEVGQTLIIPVGGIAPVATEPVATTPVEPPRPTATRDPSVPLPRLAIREARAVGVLANETIVIVNDGGPVDLAGWSLRDETGHLYVFPALMLFQDGAVNVHTAPGADTVTDLYWGQSRAVWASGATVLLSDAAGSLHTRYTVP